ncbi:MAG: hypothetical protein MUE73_18855 [Planctomycetes bacterium]|nr:hypothetical protein [Planctomycetota bacterium]
MLDGPTRKRAASGFALGLMAVGTAIYVGFRFTLGDGLAMAGIVWIGAGIFLTLLGLWYALTAPPPRLRPLLLLLANFPLSALYAVSVVDVVSRYEVRVTNATDQTLRAIAFEAPGLRVELPDLPPGGTLRRALRPRGDGSLVLRFSAADRPHEVEVVGYVTPNGGEWAAVTVGPGPAITVRRDRPAFEWPLWP